MPQNNTPDITAPVSLNRNRFVGVTGNMESGTAKGNLATGGFTNNSLGGTVYNGAGTSSNSFPVNQSSVQATGDGGAGFNASNSSLNPKSIQDQVGSRVETEKVVEFTPALLSPASSGYNTIFPKSTETIELTTTTAVKSNLEVKQQSSPNAYVGITTNRTDVVDDLTKLEAERAVVVDNKELVRIDGAKALGDPNVLYTESQREALPGGVSNSNQIKGE